MMDVSIVISLCVAVASATAFIVTTAVTTKANGRSMDKLDARVGALDDKFTAQINALDDKFTAQINALDNKFTAQINALNTRFAVLEKDVSDIKVLCRERNNSSMPA
jgi:hypothetical protein